MVYSLQYGKKNTLKSSNDWIINIFYVIQMDDFKGVPPQMDDTLR